MGYSLEISHRSHTKHNNSRQIWESRFPRRNFTGPSMLFVGQETQTVSPDLG
jgi:hypothetical protein